MTVNVGWYGLAAAKAYIETHPTENILLLEASGSCGGTWSEDRLYPGLKSNNLHGTYEYPDLPMAEDVYGVKTGQHIPAAVMHRYLTDFAKKFGVFERTKFFTKVDKLEPNDGIDGWTLTTSASPEHPSKHATLTTKKVILATGLTSTPNLPKYKGAEEFAAPFFHAKDFCRQGHTTETAKNVVVVGGAKSAFDVAYAYVNAGALVDLAIRTNGNGPIWISHPWVMGGKKQLEKLLHVRWMSWFSPCVFGNEAGVGTWPRRFLHGTRIGRWIVDKFWSALMADVIELNGYNTHEETKKLVPWNPTFWIGSGLSIHNYDKNFFDMIKDGRVRVHIADVDHLTEKTVHLSNGEALKADVLVCATGWKKESSIEFENFGSAGIGLPYPSEEQRKLTAAADHQVLEMFPRLKYQPELKFKPKSDPYRLYRYMVPPTRVQDRNIAFAGMVSTVSTAVCAAIQGVWISAFFDGNVERLARNEKEITDEVMLHTQWNKWRHPTGYGAMFPDFAFDGLAYYDLMLKDLGLKNNRKKGFLTEISEPYGPRDYEGLVQELKAKRVQKVKN